MCTEDARSEQIYRECTDREPEGVHDEMEESRVAGDQSITPVGLY